jgi:arabinan endo-1,5-alpha-L-arabinosidase
MSAPNAEALGYSQASLRDEGQFLAALVAAPGFVWTSSNGRTIVNALRMRPPLLYVLLCLLAARIAGAGPLALRGEISAHDPSTIVKDKETYWVFATGPGIRSRHSKDLISWESGPSVFTYPPAWTTNAVPGFRGFFWAPDVIHIGEWYLPYYSVST